jgi:hypothetical protein
VESALSQRIDPKVLRVARAVAREAVRDGALAVALTGSHIRGDATQHSDIDLIVLLPKPPPGRTWTAPISMREGHLVSVTWETVASVRVSFRNPALFTTFVPGWRDVLILEDTRGVAARIQVRARNWTWESVADVADAWVAQRIAGYAEEVHKLVAALEQRNHHAAAAQRSLLAVHLASFVAVRRHMLFGTDNVLWDRVGEGMGARWRRAQSRAFGESGESLAVSCRAALALYALAATEAWVLLDRRQRVAVARACAIAGHPIERTHRNRTMGAKTN